MIDSVTTSIKNPAPRPSPSDHRATDCRDMQSIPDLTLELCVTTPDKTPPDLGTTDTWQ
ncbi:hypothetical protein BaRGS_00016262, partial [Batillaria attramentaria]